MLKNLQKQVLFLCKMLSIVFFTPINKCKAKHGEKMNHKYGELNHHYYNKLSLADQKIYQKVVKGLTTREKEIMLPHNIGMSILNAIHLENPQLYYVNLKELNGVSDGIKYKYIPEYLLDETQVNHMEKAIRSMLNSFRTDNEERTIRNVHNYFVKNIEYDHSDKINFDLFNHSLVNVFTKKTSVCEGISLAFQYLLKLMDIECVCIDGQMNGGEHMWNIVLVDGYTYHIDVTADMGATQKGFKKPSYFCYMITDREMAVSHGFSEIFNCIQTKDNPFYKTGRVFANQRELCNYLSSISKSTRTFYFKYLGRDLTNDEMYSFVANNTPRSIFSSWLSYIVDDTNTLFCFHR